MADKMDESFIQVNFGFAYTAYCLPKTIRIRISIIFVPTSMIEVWFSIAGMIVWHLTTISVKLLFFILTLKES